MKGGLFRQYYEDPHEEGYTLDDLFWSVNDIYTQWDEGNIPLEHANELLMRCCNAFIKSNQPQPNL